MKPEISQKELSFLLDMSKQALAESIAKLERNGCVTREPDEADKRVMKIKLTEAGAKAADDADDAASEITKTLDCLNADELATFSEYLGRIIERYEEQFPDEDFEQRRRKMRDFMSFYGHAHHGGCGFGGHGHRHGCGFAERGCHGGAQFGRDGG